MSETTDPLAGRYVRQARFAGIGAAGQTKIEAGRVLVVGCGGLGAALVELLVRAGVGHVTVADRDVVEASNLPRQLLFTEADALAGTPKAVAAAQQAARLNSAVSVTPVVADVTAANVAGLVAGADVVLDATDNLETRYLLNDACVREGIPWVYGGAVGATGMCLTIVPGETACFRCLFPPSDSVATLPTCASVGVLSAAVVSVAARQWTEAVKLLVGDREHLCRGVAYLDVWNNDRLDSEPVLPRPDCPCCGQRRFDFLDAARTSLTLGLCGQDAVQVSPARPAALDLAELAGRLEGVGQVTVTPFLLRLAVDDYEVTVFGDGRAIVKGTADLGRARSLYAEYVGH